jgi:hypothetical protein
VPSTLHESDGQFARQQAFRKRVMAGGERIVSQKGFGSPELLAGKIVKQLLLSDVAEELLNSFKLEPAPAGQPVPSKEEQAPAIAAAVWRLAEDRDVDLLALAQNPQNIDITELEAKLMAREKELEAEAHGTAVKRAEYWRHIGALAFLQHTHKALAASALRLPLSPWIASLAMTAERSKLMAAGITSSRSSSKRQVELLLSPADG